MKYGSAVCDLKKKRRVLEEVGRGGAEFSQCVFHLSKGKIY